MFPSLWVQKIACVVVRCLTLMMSWRTKANFLSVCVRHLLWLIFAHPMLSIVNQKTLPSINNGLPAAFQIVMTPNIQDTPIITRSITMRRRKVLRFLLVGLMMFHILNFGHAFSSSNGSKPPPPPGRLTPDERQAKMLEKMGYQWNGIKWVRGDADAYNRRKASARSSNRCIVFVDATKGEPTATPSAMLAAKRMNQVLLQARQKAIPSTAKSQTRDRDFKNFVQKQEAPFLWILSEMFLFGALSYYGPIDWSREIQDPMENPLSILITGAIAGVVMSYCRATSRALLPGTEELTGKLTRILADVSTEKDAIALPAAAHIRYSNEGWKLYAFLGESLSAINIAILVNGILQPTLTRALQFDNIAAFMEPTPSTMALAATITALPAYLIVLKSSSLACDGIPAEVDAVARSNATIGAYFNMQNLPMETSAIQASHCFQKLADGWISKFGAVSNGADWKQPLLAYLGSLVCAIAYVAAAGDVVAPILARVVAAGDTYLIRDEKESSQVKVLLSKESD
jgi:hypothetical protein